MNNNNNLINYIESVVENPDGSLSWSYHVKDKLIKGNLTKESNKALYNLLFLKHCDEQDPFEIQRVPLSYYKDKLIKSLDEIYKNNFNKDINYKNNLFQCDESSINTLSMYVSNLESFTWITKDNKQVEMGKQEGSELLSLMLSRKNSCHIKRRNIKDDILSAKDKVYLDRIENQMTKDWL